MGTVDLRFDESIAEINRAHALDPLSLAINTELGSPFFFIRQYDRGVDYYRKERDMDPTFFLANYCLALCYGQQSNFTEAVNRLGGGEGISATAGYYLAVSGKTRQAEKMLDRLIAESKRDYFSPYLIAEVHLGLGHRDQAVEWLEKTLNQRRGSI